MPGAGITHAGQTLINSQYMCFVARVVHAVNVNAGRFSPGCPQSYDDTPRNAGDLVAAIIVQIPMPEALSQILPSSSSSSSTAEIAEPSR